MEMPTSFRSGDEKLPVVTSSNSAAFQEVIYIERTSSLGDVVYIPQSTVFEPRCNCTITSSAHPLLVSLADHSGISEVIAILKLQFIAKSRIKNRGF